MFNESYLKNIGKGNAQFINEVCLPLIPLVLLRYESFVDFYSEEPRNVYVKFHKNDNKQLFEQIFRLRVWIPNEITYSWNIFSSSRDGFGVRRKDGLIVRSVIWNRYLDVKKVKEASKEDKKLLLNSWPNLDINTIFLNEYQSKKLLGILMNYDKHMNNGIKLSKREGDLEKLNWSNIEISRLFDWGSVNANWSPEMENKQLEQYSVNINKTLLGYLTLDFDKIFQMDMDFSYPPEMYKKIIDGSCASFSN